MQCESPDAEGCHSRHSRLLGGDRRAAAYAIQTISEAVRHLPDDWLADYPTEPWGQIKGIGNRIRHEYFRLADNILWEVMTIDTHALKTVLEAMLSRHAVKDGS
jgi:uncharacterized protein with HEPN domain